VSVEGAAGNVISAERLPIRNDVSSGTQLNFSSLRTTEYSNMAIQMTAIGENRLTG
jgi:type IV pilus assembly protein PilC